VSAWEPLPRSTLSRSTLRPSSQISEFIFALTLKLNPARKIQAVTFDVGGTLIQPWPSVGHVYADVAARHGLKNLSPDRLNRNFVAAWRAKRNFHHTQQDWAAIVDRTFDGLCQPPPSRSFFPAIYQSFAEAAAWRLYDDAVPALEGLASRGLSLAIISNWDERLRPLLQQFRLDRYFETIVVSCEVGFAKPSGVIFEHASRRIGVPPAQILHVGDSIAEDVRGAEAAGFHSVLIDRLSTCSTAGLRISSLGALEPLIATV
jgi:putative hydrolase of the HAD superfamily